MQNSTGDGKKQDRLTKYLNPFRQSDHMAALYRAYVDEERGLRMYNCGRVIMAGRCEKCGGVHSVRLDRACGMRLCAICAMRKSRVLAAQALEALAWIEANKPADYRLFLVTLTQRNVPHGELVGEIDRLLDALSKLRRRRVVEANMLGAARTIEVTHNHRTRTWHPHVHLIVLLRADGLAKTKLDKSATWAAMWGELMRTGYKPIVDVRPISDDSGAVYEVSKYVTKFGALLDGLTDKVAGPLILELDRAVFGRQLQVWLGIWQTARRELRQKSVEKMRNEELDETATRCPDCGGALLDVLMRWNGLEYEDVPGNAL